MELPLITEAIWTNQWLLSRHPLVHRLLWIRQREDEGGHLKTKWWRSHLKLLLQLLNVGEVDRQKIPKERAIRTRGVPRRSRYINVEAYRMNQGTFPSPNEASQALQSAMPPNLRIYKRKRTNLM
jgi:hypothetical protein